MVGWLMVASSDPAYAAVINGANIAICGCRRRRRRWLWVAKTSSGVGAVMGLHLHCITAARSTASRLYCCRAGDLLTRQECMSGAVWARLGHGPKTAGSEQRLRA